MLCIAKGSPFYDANFYRSSVALRVLGAPAPPPTPSPSPPPHPRPPRYPEGLPRPRLGLGLGLRLGLKLGLGLGLGLGLPNMALARPAIRVAPSGHGAGACRRDRAGADDLPHRCLPTSLGIKCLGHPGYLWACKGQACPARSILSTGVGHA